MSRFECVPNFSEGRDPAKIESIVAPARAVAGVHVLDVERNADHHRSVVSLAGDEAPLLEAVFGMMKVAVATLDLTHHTGEHPRMGVVDVVPFIPLGSATMAEAVRLAERLADRVWRELGVPVYLYAAAARRPERADLAYVRRGGFEGIRDTIATDPSRAPDLGEPRVHPTAGIVAIGARPVLIAYNAYLTTADVEVAKKVARAVRARDGGLAEVKALGFDIKERGRAQVSMNLTDYRRTPVHRAFEAVRREAERYGAGIEESEVVGLIPQDALLDAAEFYLRLNRFGREQILERKMVGTESPAPAATATLASASLAEFVERLAARTPTPGGGSAAAATGAMGAALGEMVIAYSAPSDGSDAELAEAARSLAALRAALVALVDEDARSFEEVRAARRRKKEQPGGVSETAWAAALRRSAEVPLDTARRARESARWLEVIRPKVKATIASDLTTALALLGAAAAGALANVRINVEALERADLPHSDLSAELDRLQAPGP